MAGATAFFTLEPLAADPQGEKDCGDVLPSLAPLQARPAKAEPSWVQKGGTVNDASCLDRTRVAGVVAPRSERQVADLLAYARGAAFTVSPAGVRHSMGGQSFRSGGIMLDMRRLNQIRIHPESSTITVGAGATWHDIQKAIHPRFAIKSMQSTDIFTVGGSISVDAHGMDHRAGAVMNSLRSMRIMLADGRVLTASPTENTELFQLAVGGYGLFGIILSAEIELVPNDVYSSGRELASLAALPHALNRLMADPSIGLMYAHLSTAPDTLLDEALIYTYRKVPGSAPSNLMDVGWVKSRRLLMNLAKRSAAFQRLKWWAEKNAERQFEGCAVSRSAAMRSGEACLVSRNEPMHDSVLYLKDARTGDTNILHEYFVPRDQLVPFIEAMRPILRQRRANLLNASVRVVGREDNFLSYAPEPVYSVALYFNQRTDADGSARMKRLTSDLVDLANAHGGRFFLPYQLYYTPTQLARSYPQIRDFFAAKRKWDPENRFSNTWYERYAPNLGSASLQVRP